MKTRATCLLGLRSFSKVMSNRFIVQRNVSKLDRYIITSQSGSKCSLVSFICKYYNFYYPTFFLPKICFPYTYYEYITPLKGRWGGGGGGAHRARSGENSHTIPCLNKLGDNENPPFYQCTRAYARANDASNYAK